MIEYDPCSDEAMRDPQPLYARLRREDPVHYMPRYDAWAIASFAEVWQICGDTEHFTNTRGSHPGAVLYGLPAGESFPDTDPPAHRFRRRLVSKGYTKEMAGNDQVRIQELAREVLAGLIERPGGTMEVFGDYVNRVTVRFTAEKAGLPVADAEHIRRRIDDQFLREPGQFGMSAFNGEAAAEVAGYLLGQVAKARPEPERATGLLGELLEGTIDGVALTDQQIMWELFTVLVTGSDTTELSAAGTLYYLAQHPDQLQAVRDDPGLLPWAFAETVRFDHPTNLLARSVKADVRIRTKDLRSGQGVLLLWGSACRDEDEFEHADRYDIHRRPARTLTFGHGQHQCMGEHLAMRMGPAILAEFFAAVDSYEVDVADCGRVYGEFFKGFNRVPIRYRAKTSVSS